MSAPAARRLVLVCATLALAGCGGSSSHGSTAATSTTPAAAPAATAPALGVRDAGIVGKGPLAVHDLSYASGGRRLGAYLVVPPLRGRLPAVIVLHGAEGSRTTLLPWARFIAARGAVALAVDAPEGRTDPSTLGSGMDGLRRQHALTLQTIADLRRAVDLLAARPDVDARRIGFIGWSFGARTGALLAGAEHRIRAYDLISAGAAPVQVEVAAAPPDVRPEATRLFTDIDPIGGVHRSAPGTVFLEDGTLDEVVPRAALDAVAQALPKGSRVRWYGGGHAPGKAELQDGLDWLSGRLGLATTSRVPGAPAGP
jgi:dienelactone hydrolase